MDPSANPIAQELAELAAALSSANINGLSAIGAATFLTYDSLLCFPLEVEYIWLAKHSLIKYLYLVTRIYGVAHVMYVLNLSGMLFFLNIG
ncbi:hypothetical protein GGX14DRAFT_197719 [Mycena pura]|uniref:DUF6533 domain-containing protein n=1 Tax=Mycena pura TaxID=153505 RepID=A0AAD6Y1A6_9AGAR|nr:hypothetical protein GGX14DRAFT_197719 [Mycena pura]